MFFVVALLLHSSFAPSQQAAIRIEVRASQKPVAGAKVVVGGTPHATDESGVVVVPVGRIRPSS